MSDPFKKTSKYLSFILRHDPESIGLKLDSCGWASIDDLITKSSNYKLDHEIINIVVETNDKKRFSISKDGQKIKANQGHSIDIDLDLEPTIPPEVLYHGTANRFIKSIQDKGLIKKNRHHVHLSESTIVAESVGSRYGKPAVLAIKAKEMHDSEYRFYKTINNVWLVDNIPIYFISFP